MALKPRYKRRIFWTAVITTGVVAMGIVLVPPMITLNGLKPKIQDAIAQQTGIAAEIRGDVHFSLLGRATIVAHDIVVPMGNVSAAMFAIPISGIFNLADAPLSGNVAIYGANVVADTLVPQNFGHKISINNSTVHFKGKDYEIVKASLRDGQLVGIVRTADHKYDINFAGDEFYIQNQNNNLEIQGQLYADGSARGQLAIETDDINKWFEFTTPRITQTINMTMDFEWDGGYGFKFTDIVANDFTGNITLMPDGEKDIQLASNNLVYDFSFLMNPTHILYKTNYDLDFYGDLTFADHHFNHLKINAIGTPDKLQIASIIADDIAITGGTIDADGAHNIMITMPYNGDSIMCMFSGTPQSWKCTDFSYNDMSGSIGFENGKYSVFIQSAKPMPERETLTALFAPLGTQGQINFQFANIGGTIDISGPDKIKPSYTFAHDKTLQWLNSDFGFLPTQMRNDIGDFAWINGTVKFLPHSRRWAFELSDTKFLITGQNIKDLFPDLDLQAFNNLPYTISGTYAGDKIANLMIKIANHEFTGSASGNNITLKTQILNLDTFISQEFIDDYAQREFLTGAPIMIPFSLPLNVSLSANSIIYNGQEYKNFVYSLKPGVQTFSIMDTSRGNLLATISKHGNQYDISAQLNKFVIGAPLLSSAMPLNVRDTTITAEINMNTWGHIAHDIEYNMNGNMDMSFAGGKIMGLGIDEFFASANNITTLNAEYAIANALEQGETALKNMRIVGKYENGDFKTTMPISLQMRHTDATGEIEISDGRMSATLRMILRGTSPRLVPIELDILPDGTRNYALSEIMMNFDPSFMRDFVKSHDKF